MVRPVLGAGEKQSGCISSVCVMWKRQRVPNTIPFSKGKTSISHTHTRCFAYFSKLRHTHTHTVSPPLAAALILGAVNCETQSRFFLGPRWPSAAGLFWYRREVKVAAAVCRLWLLAFPRTWEKADLQRTYQGRLMETYFTRLTKALVFAHTLNVVTCLDRRGKKWYDLWPSQKNHGKLKFFWTWYPRNFTKYHCIPMLPSCLKNMKIL